MRLTVRLAGVLVVLLAPMLVALQAGQSTDRGQTVCRLGYAYTGQEYSVIRHGVRATLGLVTRPRVVAGHVGGWVGVRGPRAGPRGPVEWLQAGVASFDTGQSEIYYEVARPSGPPSYHAVRSPVRPHLVSVLEMSARRGMWRVWIDNRAVSPPLRLPTSHARLVPQAIGENWNTTRRCNSYEYRFQRIQVAARPGGSWTAAARAFNFHDAHHRLVTIGPGSFITRSLSVAISTSPDEPPLLGALATALSGRTLTARCVRRSGAVREVPSGRLLLPVAECETLVGYAVAEPWVPRANSSAGSQIALQGLVFLRGVARATHVPAARVDCRAVGTFYRAFRRLGATAGQALALRAQLLRRRVAIAPRLSLAPGCPFH